MYAPISNDFHPRRLHLARLLGRLVVPAMVVGAAVALLFVSGRSQAAPRDAYATVEDGDELNLFWMGPRITSCGSCESKSWDRGKHCYDCTHGGCNCLLQWFVDPASGQEYDGSFYPGVPISP